MIALPALIVPIVGFSGLGISDGRIEILGIERAPHGSIERMRVEAGFVAAVAGTWWLVLAGLVTALMKPHVRIERAGYEQQHCADRRHHDSHQREHARVFAREVCRHGMEDRGEKHVGEVFATGCFLDAHFEQSAPDVFRSRYAAASQEVLDRYIAEHAPRLREDFHAHFPAGVRLTRVVWTERARYE